MCAQLVEGEADVYAAEPPTHPPLRGRKADSTVTTNLMSAFVSMRVELPGAGDVAEERTYGRVLGMQEFVAWLAGEP